MLAVVSLIFAGLFAFLLAMARTPHIQDILPGKDYFRVALVDHVVLSIVIWFLTFSGVLWALTATGFTKREIFCIRLGMTGVCLSAVGTVLIILPALMGLGTPLFTNYVPVLDHPVYYTGLFVFAVGLSLFLVDIAVTLYMAWRDGLGVFRAETYGMATAGLAVGIAFLCYLLAYLTFPADLKKFIYLEHFFWGGGHILQFANTIGMLAAWILLARLTLGRAPVADNTAVWIFSIFVPFILSAPFIFLFTTGGEPEFKKAFTVLMQYGLGPSTFLLTLAVLAAIFQRRSEGRLPWSDPGFASLFFSMVLFATGGILALFIKGTNTKIPSHYHGVIGAVTISFMGLTYHILPMMGRKIPVPRLARVQPYLYGVGQLLFVAGMFWAGSHGVARKTYGAAQGLDDFAKLAGMTIMGIGGLVAISGGAAYVYNVLFSLLGKTDGS